MHDALKVSGYTGHPLEVMPVRLLFDLFTSDAGEGWQSRIDGVMRCSWVIRHSHSIRT